MSTTISTQRPLVIEINQTCSTSSEKVSLDFTEEEVKKYQNIPPYSCPNEYGQFIDVPASYIRDKGAAIFRSIWLNPTQATHNLIIKACHDYGNIRNVEVYAVHEMVLLTQCANWQDVLIGQQSSPHTLPILKIKVPFPEDMFSLMEFLHLHDEQRLYQLLVHDRPAISNFICNVRALGVHDPRIKWVLQQL